MKNVVRTTKKDVLNAMKAYFEANDVDLGTVTIDEALDYINTTISQLDDKAVKAKAKAAEKKEKGDELRETVLNVLTDEYQTIDAIVEKVGNSEVTKSMVVARLSQLCKADVAHKAKVDVDGRKLNGYAAGAAPAEADAE